MNRIAACVVLVLGAVAPAGGRADEAESVRRDRERYAGTWKVVSIAADGNAPGGEAREIVVVNAADGTWRLSVDGRQVSAGTSRIDPLADPKEIDLEITEGDGKGSVLLGIYDFDGDRRRLCFRGRDGWRPRAFEAAAGSGAVLVEFERK